MRRRRIPIFPYFAIALSVTITVALSFGITRYRAPVDAVLPVLAAMAHRLDLAALPHTGRPAAPRRPYPRRACRTAECRSRRSAR